MSFYYTRVASEVAERFNQQIYIFEAYHTSSPRETEPLDSWKINAFGYPDDYLSDDEPPYRRDTVDYYLDGRKFTLSYGGQADRYDIGPNQIASYSVLLDDNNIPLAIVDYEYKNLWILVDVCHEENTDGTELLKAILTKVFSNECNFKPLSTVF